MVSAFNLGSLPYIFSSTLRGLTRRVDAPIATYLQNVDTIVIEQPEMQMHGVPENGGVTTTLQQHHHHFQNFLFEIIVASATAGAECVTLADLVNLNGVTTTKLEMENRRNLDDQLLRKLSFF